MANMFNDKYSAKKNEIEINNKLTESAVKSSQKQIDKLAHKGIELRRNSSADPVTPEIKRYETQQAMNAVLRDMKPMIDHARYALQSKAIRDVTQEGARIIMPTGMKNTSDPRSNISNVRVEEKRKAYQDLGADFFKKLYSPVDGIADAGSLTINYEHVSNKTSKQSPVQLFNALNNIKNKGKIKLYDIEAHSGRNLEGEDEFYALTEIAFQDVNFNQETQKWELGETIGSVVGSTEKEDKEYQRIIKKFYSGSGEKISERERVIMKRLLQAGHASSKVVNHGNGIWRFENFAGEDDAWTGGMKEALRGAELYRNIGIDQEKSTNMVNWTHSQFGTFKVKGYEKILLDQYTDVIQNGTSLAGYNSEFYDTPNMDRWLQHGLQGTYGKTHSQGFADALGKLTNGKFSVGTQNNFDAFAFLNTVLDRVDELYQDKPEILKTIHSRGLGLRQQEALAYMGGLNPNTGLSKWYGDSGKAHLAEMDINILARILFGDSLADAQNVGDSTEGIISRFTDRLQNIVRQETENINPKKSVLGQTEQLLGGGRQLFLAQSGQSADSYNLLGFRKDELTGEYRTTDGFSIADMGNGKTKVRKELPNQYLQRKEAAYTIDSISYIDKNSEHMKKLAEINPALARNDLAQITFTPIYSNPDRVPLGIKTGQSTYIGSIEDIKRFVNERMLLVGQRKDQDQQWQLTDNKKVREMLKVLRVEDPKNPTFDGGLKASKVENGVETLYDPTEFKSKKQGTDFIYDYLLPNAQSRSVYESASREIRDFNFKKDAAMLSFVEAEDFIIGDAKGNKATEKARQWRKTLFENTKKLIQEARVKGSTEGLDVKGTFFEYFGWEDFKTGNHEILSESIAKGLARVDHMRLNKDYYRAVINKAREMVGLEEVPAYSLPGSEKNVYFSGVDQKNVKPEADYFYKNLHKGFETKLQLQHADKVAKQVAEGKPITFEDDVYAHHKVNLGTYGFEHNKYQIDLKGFRNISDEFFLSADLDSAGYGVTKTLFKKVYGKELDKKQEGQTAAGLLRDLQEKLSAGILQDISSINDEDPFLTEYNQNYKIGKNDTIEEAEAKFTATLKYHRNVNPLAGKIKSTARMTADPFMIQPGKQSIVNLQQTKDTLDEIAKTIPMPETVRVNDEEALLTKAKTTARQIVNGVMSSGYSDDEIRDKLESIYGKGSKQVDFMLAGRKARRREMQEYVQNMVWGALKNGISIIPQAATRSVHVKYGSQEVYEDITKFLPKEGFANGQFYSTIGGMKVVTPLGIYEKRNTHELQLGSLFLKGMRSKESFAASIRGGIEEGSVFSGLKRALSNSNRAFTKISNERENTELQEMRNQLIFPMSDIIGKVDKIYANQSIDHPNPKIVQAIQDLVERVSNGEKVDIDNIGLEQYSALYNNMDQTLRLVLNQSNVSLGGIFDEKMLQSLQENLITRTYKREKMILSFGENSDAFDDAAPDSRPIMYQYGRAVPIEASKTQRELSALGDKYGYNRGLYAGASVQSRIKYNLDKQPLEGFDREFATNLRMTRVSLSSAQTREIVTAKGSKDGVTRLQEVIAGNISEYALNGDKYDVNAAKRYGQDLAEFMYMSDGSGVMDARIMDKVAHKSSTQQIRADQTMFYDEIQDSYRDWKDRIDTLFDIDIQDGKFKFKYGSGKYVEKDEYLLPKVNADGTARDVYAKETGILNMGLFSNDGIHLAKEKEVEELLNLQLSTEIIESMKKNKKLEAKEKERLQQLAYRTLQDVYKMSFYVDSIFQSTNPKGVVSGVEKAETKGLYGKLGLINTEIGDFFENMKGANKLIGEVLDISYIDSLKGVYDARTLARSKFVSLVGAMRARAEIGDLEANGTRLSAAQKRQILHSNELKTAEDIMRKFGNGDEFGKKILRERYLINDSINKHFVSSLNLDDVSAHGEFATSRIMLWHNDMADRMKGSHSDPKGLAFDTISDLLHKYGNDAQKVVDILSAKDSSGKAAITGLTVVDGNVIHDAPDGHYEFNIGRINDVIKEEFGGRQWVEFKDGNGNIQYGKIGTTDWSHLKTVDNPRSYSSERATQKAVSLDDRALLTMQAYRVSDARLGVTRKHLESAVGADKAAEIMKLFDAYGTRDGSESISSGAMEYISGSIWTKPKDDKKTATLYTNSYYTGETLADGTEDKRLRYENMPEEMKKALAENGVSEDRVKAVLKSAEKHGATAISQSVIEMYDSAYEHEQAMYYNKHGIEHINPDKTFSLEGGKKIGVINIGSLEIPHRADGSVELGDVLFNKSLVIDKHVEGLADEYQPYNTMTGEGRYVYVPKEVQGMNGESFSLSETQKTVSRIARQSRGLSLQQKGEGTYGPQGDIELTKARDRLEGLWAEVEKNIQAGIRGKKGYLHNLSKAELQDSTAHTAYGSELYGSEQGSLGKVTFEGVNFSEQAAKATLSEQVLKEGGKATKDVGLLFNYTVLNNNAMHDLYDAKIENVMKEFGFDEDLINQTKSSLYDRVRTQGSVGLGIRYPMYYADSAAPQVILFSDAVGDDEAIVGAVGFRAQKGDYDSDKRETLLLKSRAKIQVGEKTIFKDLDEASYQVLRNAIGSRGGSVEWADEKEASKMQRNKAAVFESAVHNWEWREKDNVLTKYSEFGQNLRQYTIEGTYSGTIMSVNDDEIMGKQEVLKEKYDKLESDAIEYYNNNHGGKFKIEKEAENGGAVGTELTDKSWNELKDYQKRNAIWNYMADSGLDAQATEEGLQALHYAQRTSIKALEDTKGVLRKGAGETNAALYKYLSVINESGVLNGEEFELAMEGFTALQEGYIAPKNVKEDFDPAMATKLKDAFNNAYSAMAGQYDIEKARTEMREVLSPVLTSDKAVGDWLNKNMQMSMFAENRLSEEEIPEAVMKAFIDKPLERIQMNRRATVKALDAGVAINGTDYNGLLEGEHSRVSETVKTVLTEMQEEQQDMKTMFKESIAQKASATDSILNYSPKRNFESVERNSNVEVMRGLAQAAKRIGKSGQGFGLAAGLVGIAGGIMISGFANKPYQPNPAETQAAGAQEEAIDQYQTSQVPEFSDTNINRRRNGPSNGYVINISANTDSGRSKAVSAINDAIGMSVPRTTSINIQQNTSYKDKLQQFQIDQMVANAL